MNEIERKIRSVLSSLLISLLIGAQTISLAHASEHEVDLQQDSCAICVGSSQLSAAATDSGHVYAERLFGPILCSNRQYALVITFTETPRQRGPPAQL